MSDGLYVTPVRVHRGYVLEAALILRAGDIAVMSSAVGLSLPANDLLAEQFRQWLLLNDDYRYGSIRLVQLRESRTVMQGHRCDPATTSPQVLNAVVATLTNQLEAVVTRLYACDLIPLGPESDTVSPQNK